jgi:hypothetical protein
MRRPQHRFAARIVGRVLDYVRDHPLCDSGDVARHVIEPALDIETRPGQETRLDQEYALCALVLLVARGLVMTVPAPHSSGYLYVAYKVGECETCGAFDHCLALGACPACVRRYWPSARTFTQASLFTQALLERAP